MGKIDNGILGGFSGKVGPVVGASWKGIQYMRAYKVPANPNTPSQQTQRSKMGTMSQIASACLGTIIQTYWDPFAEAMSGFNEFVKTNINLLDASNDMTVNNKVALGSLESAEILTAEYEGGTGVITFTWDDSIVGNGNAQDDVHIVVYENALGIWRYESSGLVREDATGSVTATADTDPTSMKAYLFLSRGTGEEFVVSDSTALEPTS